MHVALGCFLAHRVDSSLAFNLERPRGVEPLPEESDDRLTISWLCRTDTSKHRRRDALRVIVECICLRVE